MELVLIYSDTKSFEPLQSIIPVSLMMVMGKPLIQHQLEMSYSQGIRQCTIIASDNLEKIRDYCGDGSRFGVRLNLVTAAASGDETESLLRQRNLLGDCCLVLAGRTLANLPIDKLRQEHEESQKCISIVRHGKSKEIIGLLTSPPTLGELFDNGRGNLQYSAKFLMEHHPDEINIIDADFSYFICHSIADVLRLTAAVLEAPADYIYDTHFSVQDSGIHLGHHTMIHPKAVLRPPVAIGDFCQVAAGAQIGPNASISSGTIVSKDARISNSIVAPNSFVGEMMEVKDAVVVGPTLVHPLTGVKVYIGDPLLLDGIEGDALLRFTNSFVHRATAISLLAALAPVGISLAILSRARNNNAIVSKPTLGSGDVKDGGDVERLPRFNRFLFADETLPMSWYPSLLNVAKGQMRFVGPKPVGPDEKTAPSAVQSTVRYSVPPGLFAVGDLFDEASEEAALAEAIYIKKQGLVQDVRCAAAKLAAKFIGKRKARWLSGL